MANDIIDIANAADRLVTKFETVTNNLANASTIGFKEEYLHFLAQHDISEEKDIKQTKGNLNINMGQGMIQQTGNALDLALDGDGFFVIQTKDGELYTRKGNFQLSKTNKIVTSSGEEVLGSQGPIVASGKNVHVDAQGTVTVDGNPAGKLKLVTFAQPKNLEKVGNAVFRDPGTAGLKVSQDAKIVSSSVELSNVNPIEQMVTMIELQRRLEIYQKIIQTISDEDKISTSRIGRLG